MRTKLILALMMGLILASSAVAHPGWGIVRDSRGNLYYTDLRQVWRMDAAGRKTVVVPQVHTHELYMDPQDNLYGVHLWYESATRQFKSFIWKLGSDGRYSKITPGGPGYDAEFSFARDRAGTMYWVDGSTVRRKTPPEKSSVLAQIPLFTPPASGRPPSGLLTATPDGTVYLMRDGDLVKVTPAGQVARIAKDLNEHNWSSFIMQPWHYVMGIAADQWGNVYVANSGARVVKKVGTDGKVTVFTRSRFPWSPTGVLPVGRAVYILEYTDTGWSTRVRKVGAE